MDLTGQKRFGCWNVGEKISLLTFLAFSIRHFLLVHFQPPISKIELFEFRMKICRCQSIVSTKHDTTILQIPFVLRNLRKCDSAPVLLPSGQFQVRVTSVPVLRWLPIGVTSEVTSSGKSGGSHGVAFVGGCEVKTRLSVRVIKPHNNQSCWGL